MVLTGVVNMCPPCTQRSAILLKTVLVLTAELWGMSGLCNSVSLGPTFDCVAWDEKLRRLPQLPHTQEFH